MTEQPVVEISGESVPIYTIGWPVTVSVADAYSIAQSFGRKVDGLLTSRAGGVFPDRADPYGYLNIERAFLGVRILMKDHEQNCTFHGSDAPDKYLTWAALTRAHPNGGHAIGFELGFMSAHIFYEDLPAMVEGTERRRRRSMRRAESGGKLQPEMSLTSHVRLGNHLEDLMLRTNPTITLGSLEALAQAKLTRLANEL